MKTLRIFTLVTLIGICLNSRAQNQEYIITFDNDTIYGKVRVNGLKFIDKNRNKSAIKPDEVSEFYSIDGLTGNNGHFESVFVMYDSERSFLKRIINGRIKMFSLTIYFRTEFGINSEITYYLSKNDSEVTTTDIGKLFSRKKSHKQVREFIADNNEILKEFDGMKGSEKNIRYIIEKYNKYYEAKAVKNK